MDAKAIVAKIDEDAKNAASQILSEASARSTQMQTESQQRIDDAEKAMLKKVESNAVQMRKQMIRMAELELKKEMLSKKQHIMNKTFEEALSKMRKMPMDKIKDLLFKIITSNAEGSEEIIIGDLQSSWFDDDMLLKINEAITKEGKKKIVKSSKTLPNAVGAILVKDGVEMNCTIEGMLYSVKHEMESEVAVALFRK